MWFCHKCNRSLLSKEVTYDEKCTVCGVGLLTKDEVINAFNRMFRFKHDLYNAREQLNNYVRKDVKSTAANEKLWIDIISDKLEELENILINKDK